MDLFSLNSHTLLPDGIFRVPSSDEIFSSERLADDRNSIKGIQLSIRQTDEPWQVCYGKMRLGGIYSFVTTDVPAAGEWLHTFITYAAHETRKVTKVVIDKKEVTFLGVDINGSPYGWGSGEWGFDPPAITSYVFASCLSTGAQDQPANADLVSQSSQLFPLLWTEAHRQRGHAGIYLIFYYDPVRFPNGNPKVELEIEGKADIYDPRTGLRGYTNNAALCAADYILQPDWGMGASYVNQIDEANLIEAANICDETVTLALGGTEARYTVNGTFNLSDDPRDIINRMGRAMGGDITYTSGRWKFYPGKWRAPTITLTRDDLLGSTKVQTHLQRNDHFNTIQGKYVSPENNWEVADLPVVKNSSYIARDGRTVTEDVSLSFTTSKSAGQRLLKIELEKANQPISFEADYSLKAYPLEIGDNVYIEDTELGWTPKAFSVRKRQRAFKVDRGVPYPMIQLQLRETAEGIYDWNEGEETIGDLAPNTNLPDPTIVFPPTNLELDSGTDQLLERTDGSLITRVRVDWDLTNDPYVRNDGLYQIQWKLSSISEWIESPSVPGDHSFTYLLDMPDGQYIDVRVRSLNGIRNPSEWVTVFGHFVIGQTANPSDPTNFRAIALPYGIFFGWNLISDPDASAYIIKAGSSWTEGDDNLITIVPHPGNSYIWPIQVAGHYDFVIRAIDRSGNLSNDVHASLDIAKPATPLATFQIIGPDLILKWAPATPGQFALKDYEIRYGLNFATSTFIAHTGSTAYTIPVNWGSVRRFFISARDVALNLSDPAAVDVNILIPTTVSGLRPEVIDNNVLLYWNEPSVHSLPVKLYEIYKGDVFETAVLIGEKSGTFTTVQEQAAGTYSYWVVPVDTANNIGTAVATSAKVSQPPDYVLLDDRALDPNAADTLDNLVIVDDGFAGAAILDESWQQHFVSGGWSTILDQIEAGYPVYLHPANSSPGIYEDTIDFGTVLPGVITNLAFVRQDIFGAADVAIKFSHSPDNSSFTEIEGPDAFIPAGMRYLKVRIEVTSTLPTDLVYIRNLRLRINVKKTLDSGKGSALASDYAAGGTLVDFNLDYIDIDSITVTPFGDGLAEERTPIVNFLDEPDPESFRVVIFDETGSPVNCDFSWQARGVAR